VTTIWYRRGPQVIVESTGEIHALPIATAASFALALPSWISYATNRTTHEHCDVINKTVRTFLDVNGMYMRSWKRIRGKINTYRPISTEKAEYHHAY